MLDELELSGAGIAQQAVDEHMKAGTPFGKQVAMFQQ
jgi:hypothetical protein